MNQQKMKTPAEERAWLSPGEGGGVGTGSGWPGGGCPQDK